MKKLNIFKREYKRPKQTGEPFRQSIAFIGLSRNAGTTSLALSFAKGLNEEISFVEIQGANNEGAVYDKLGFEERKKSFYNESESDYFEIMEEGIHFFIRNPKLFSTEIDSEFIMQKLLLPRTAKSVFDVGTEVLENPELFNSIRNHMDIINIVIDPLPSKIINKENILLMLKEAALDGAKINYIINKMSDRVPKKELFSFLQIKDAKIAPFYDASELYKTEYACKFPSIES
jgi:hypothetical protein